MVKNSELHLSKLKRRITILSVFVILLTFSIVIYAATTVTTVNIYDGENVIILNTKTTTVSQLLEEVGITLGTHDDVVPPLKTQLTNNMDINVCRAVIVKITESNNTIQTLCAGPAVFDILKKNGVHIGQFDEVVPAVNTPVSNHMEIVVKRAKALSFTVGENTKRVYTCFDTVGEVCKNEGYELNENCYANYPAVEPVAEGMEISVSNLTFCTETVEEVIPYNVVLKSNNDLDNGIERTIQYGTAGKKIINYNVSYLNGSEVKREVLSETVLASPADEIKEYGTARTVATSRGEVIRYSKVIQCTATAYDLSYESCGKNPGDRGYGITASGMKAQYGVVAVDPKVIPLGTRLYIESYDGSSWSYGYCIAGDTGGGIRGNRVDLFYNSRSEALQFGRKVANVYVLQ